MRHIAKPQLRRLADEPLAIPDSARRHLAGCGRCQPRSSKIAANAAVAARLLTAPADVSDADVDAKWAMLLERLEEPRAARRRVRSRLWRTRRGLAGASVGTGTAVVVGVLTLGVAAAAALTTVYAPTHVAPVRVDQADLRAIENLVGANASQLPGGLPPSGSRRVPFGEVNWTTSGHAELVNSIARASALTHLQWSAPASLPAGVGTVRSIAIQPQVTMTVTFSKGAGAGIAASRLDVTLGPAIVVGYGSRSGPSGPMTLIIAAMQRPVASATGATTSELEQFLFKRAGLPAGLADELRLIGNPTTTLPVPVPSGLAEQQLQVAGSPAVLLTVPPGIASAVIWEPSNGVVHAVAGLLDKEDILSVARQIG